MTCPRCGQPDVLEPVCPRCGVVVAKARSPEERPRRPARADERLESSDTRRTLGLEALAVLAAIGLAVMMLRGRVAAPSPPPAPAASPARGLARMVTPSLPPPALDLPEIVLPPAASSGLADPGDRQLFDELAGRVRLRARVAPDELQKAEFLLVRQPTDPARQSLLVSLLLLASEQERAARRPEQAVAHARRAVEVQPGSLMAGWGLLQALNDAEDWPAAEAAARALLSGEARDADALRALGFALMKQDRGPEAREALKASLDARNDPRTRSLFDLVSKSLADQQGMTEQKLSHFHVRYDGGQHEDVGREVLRALERHYATLTRTFDHQPAGAIPVVLFSQQAYFDATGAPVWSGGQYDHYDGRITVPIGGLTSSLTPTLDAVLIHELAHAFISDRSRGTAPREIQEGLAQYVEGRRVEDMLGGRGLRALADGRIRGVSGYYAWSLAFVEQLMAERGQGGMNDALRIMGETGRPDEAFSRVYGRPFAESARAFEARLRLQHGR